jgi:hypothetical protein
VKVRYQADNDLNQRIVAATLRLEPAIDFRTAAAAGLHEGVDDPEVLAIAAGDGRVLVTHDRRTMPDHFGRFVAERHSPGVILIPQSLPIARAAEWLHLIWVAADADEFLDVFYTIA